MVGGGAVYKHPLKRGGQFSSKLLGIVRYSTRAQSPVSLSADSSFAKGAKVKDKARPTKDRAARVGAALRSKPRRPSYLARRLSRGSIRQRGTEDPLFGRRGFQRGLSDCPLWPLFWGSGGYLFEDGKDSLPERPAVPDRKERRVWEAAPYIGGLPAGGSKMSLVMFECETLGLSSQCVQVSSGAVCLLLGRLQ